MEKLIEVIKSGEGWEHDLFPSLDPDQQDLVTIYQDLDGIVERNVNLKPTAFTTHFLHEVAHTLHSFDNEELVEEYVQAYVERAEEKFDTFDSIKEQVVEILSTKDHSYHTVSEMLEIEYRIGKAIENIPTVFMYHKEDTVEDQVNKLLETLKYLFSDIEVEVEVKEDIVEFTLEYKNVSKTVSVDKRHNSIAELRNVLSKDEEITLYVSEYTTDEVKQAFINEMEGRLEGIRVEYARRVGLNTYMVEICIEEAYICRGVLVTVLVDEEMEPTKPTPEPEPTEPETPVEPEPEPEPEVPAETDEDKLLKALGMTKEESIVLTSEEENAVDIFEKRVAIKVPSAEVLSDDVTEEGFVALISDGDTSVEINVSVVKVF